MSEYVDGFVIPVPKDKVADYRRLAKKAAKLWQECGALDYRECVGDDLAVKNVTPFTRLAKTKPGETVIFSWVTFKSRKHRDEVNARLMKDPRMKKMGEESHAIFDCKRMAYGGFKTLVQA